MNFKCETTWMLNKLLNSELEPQILKSFDSHPAPLPEGFSPVPHPHEFSPAPIPSRNSRNIPVLNKNDAISGYFDLKHENSTVLMKIISINILNTDFKIFNRFHF